MSRHDTPDSKPAKIRTSRTLLSTVWLIPLLAALSGGWLLVQNLRSKGPEITLLMDNAEGIEANTTTIRVLNVEVGRVTAIRLRPDQTGVELTASLSKDVDGLMREDTQFWVVKPRIDQNGITGLGTLLSGSYIAFTPGKSGKPADEFKVSDLPPVTAIGQSGIRLYLSGKNSKMVTVGSPVLFENHQVGTVESARFDPADQTVQYTIFIQSPNDSLLSSYSRFWLDSGINVRTDGGGVSIQTPPLAALLSGAVSFDTPKYRSEETQKPARNGDRFKIYNNRTEIENLPGRRTLYYVVFFENSVRGLSAGDPVEYKGIKVGTVAEVPYFSGSDSLKLFEEGRVPVRIRIDPYRLELGSAEHKSKEYWQESIRSALAKGLGASLSSSNLLLGSKMIELTDGSPEDTLFKPAAEYGGDPVIGTRGGSLDDLQTQINRLLEKFNALPLEQTVGELNGSLKELKSTLKSAKNLLDSADKLVGRPETQNLPAELNQTLQELRNTLQGVSPQSPVYQDVQQTLKSLDRTLKDAQPVINTLKDQPNALIFNKTIKDPVPKGSRR